MNKKDLYHDICNLRVQLEGAMRAVPLGEAANNEHILIISRKLDNMIDEYVRTGAEE